MPDFDPRTVPEFVELLEHHRSNPEVSDAEHLAMLEYELAEEALGKTRIYLDLRYWIFLRDAALGEPQRSIHMDLLNGLAEGVESGRIVCPITDSVFFEIERQGETDRRLHSIQTINRLSKGIVIKNAVDRLHSEVIHFLSAITERSEPPAQPCRSVWVRPFCFLGTPQIVGGWSESEQLAINKALISYMWSRSVEDLLGENWIVADEEDDERFRDSARKITEYSARQQLQMRSFPQVLAAEVGGFVDSHRPDIFEAFQSFIRRHSSDTVDTGASSVPEEEMCANIIYNAIKKKKTGVGLPLIRIVAGLRANIRWKRNRPFKFQDFFDIYHATAALPYCDIFLTERELETYCNERPLEFASSFATEVISDEGEALDAVSRIVA